MRVFIFEHICGGGLARFDLRPTLIRKGGAMLAALAADFVQAGVEVTTSLDCRADLALEGARVTRVEPGADFMPIFDRLAREADAALAVAPEFDGLLEGWARRIKTLGVRSLGCTPEAISACGDKLELSRRLTQAGVVTPPTKAGLRDVDLTRGPVIAKPRFGAGCEDTFLCRTSAALAQLPQRGDWIVQPFVPGLAASCAFIVHGKQIRPLRAGQQFVLGEGRLAYRGGRMPLAPALEDRAIALGTRALGAVEGLDGYVGVDLVLGEGGGDASDNQRPAGGVRPDVADVVIEINPRPTVAFTGLRRLCRTNLAAAILDPTAALMWHDKSLSYDASGTFRWEA